METQLSHSSLSPSLCQPRMLIITCLIIQRWCLLNIKSEYTGYLIEYLLITLPWMYPMLRLISPFSLSCLFSKWRGQYLLIRDHADYPHWEGWHWDCLTKVAESLQVVNRFLIRPGLHHNGLHNFQHLFSTTLMICLTLCKCNLIIHPLDTEMVTQHWYWLFLPDWAPNLSRHLRYNYWWHKIPRHENWPTE